MSKLSVPMINTIRELAAPGSVAENFTPAPSTLAALVSRGILAGDHTFTDEGRREQVRLGITDSITGRTFPTSSPAAVAVQPAKASRKDDVPLPKALVSPAMLASILHTKAERARMAGTLGRHATPLTDDERKARYILQNKAARGKETLTPAQLRRLSHKGAHVAN